MTIEKNYGWKTATDVTMSSWQLSPVQSLAGMSLLFEIYDPTTNAILFTATTSSGITVSGTSATWTVLWSTIATANGFINTQTYSLMYNVRRTDSPSKDCFQRGNWTYEAEP